MVNILKYDTLKPNFYIRMDIFKSELPDINQDLFPIKKVKYGIMNTKLTNYVTLTFNNGTQIYHRYLSGGGVK